MNKQEFENKYWRYYLMLEEDFLKTIRFVEIDEVNFNTYSVEYTKQYQSICSEFDVLCKVICKFIDEHNSPGKIEEYANIILRNNNEITGRIVGVKNSNTIELKPLLEWKIEGEYKSPNWWSSYNKVKHNRTEHYKKANLQNVLNSLSGLYVLEMYLLEIVCERQNEGVPENELIEKNEPSDKSKIFRLKNWKNNDDEFCKHFYENVKSGIL